MAYGYGLSGKGVAACLATSGGASIHLGAGVAAAYANSIPMMVITGQVERWKWGKGAFQDFSGVGPRSPNALSMFETMTTYSALPQTVEELPQILANIYMALNSVQRGPVHLSLPADLLTEDVGKSVEWRALCREDHNTQVINDGIISNCVTSRSSILISTRVAWEVELSVPSGGRPPSRIAPLSPSVATAHSSCWEMRSPALRHKEYLLYGL